MRFLCISLVLIFLLCGCSKKHVPIIDWAEAEWITAPQPLGDRGNDISVADEHNPIFTRTFNIDDKLISAKLQVSALGCYDLWVNGERVGTITENGETVYDELKPGWTNYNKRVFYNLYDITPLCHRGENEIRSVVSWGWLRGRIARNQYSKLPMAFIAKIDLEYKDGSHQVIATDGSWTCLTSSPILSGNIYDGEIYDARRDMQSTEGKCPVDTYGYRGKLAPAEGTSVRICEHRILPVVSTVIYDGVKDNGKEYGEINITRQFTGPTSFTLGPGETAIVDFGQNCAALPELEVQGQAGSVVNLRFGEVLNDSGDPARRNDNAAGSLYTANLRNAKARVHYVLNGDPDGELYVPSSTYFGYRYCEITASAEVTIVAMRSLPISSVQQTTGRVETDNKDVNRLFENVLWSQLSNFVSIPTDCPQRDERLGWTADAHLFAPVAMYNADMGPFYRKWLGDIRDSQRDDGAYSDVSPLSLKNYGTGGWADAGIIVPWQIFLMTGDKEAVSEHYESMEAYMGWLSTLRDDGLRYPGGYTTYGDAHSSHKMDNRLVSQAYYYYDAVLMAKMSRLLGYDDKGRAYDVLARNIRDEIQTRYFDQHGLISPTQGACVLCLYFGLYVSDEQRKSLAQTLVNRIHGNENRLQTGFLSSAYLLQVLCDNGMVEQAYDLLTQRALPSWMYMVDNGATTVWETWTCFTQSRGFSNVTYNSFNHIVLGAFASWFYSHMAGIAPCEESPGFNRVIFSPCIDTRDECKEKNKINHVYGHKIVEKGVITAEWQLNDDGTLIYVVNIPEGVTGEMRFPVPSAQHTVYVNNEPVNNVSKVKPLGYVDGRQIFDLKAGAYLFSTSIVDEDLIPSLLPVNLHTWPNPAFDRLHFSIDDDILSLNVSSASGITPNVSLLDNSTLDVSRLYPGVYLLSISTGHRTYVAKFIKI